MKCLEREGFIYLVVVALVITGFVSCGERLPEPLSREQREFRDSLITEGLRHAAKVQDSLCTVQSDSLVNHFYDSLLNARLDEIEKLQRRR